MNKTIYLDHAATTFVKEEVLKEMLPYFTEDFGNASTVYSLGQRCRLALDNARQRCANVLGCGADEIYFTASGSEADNWAIKGAARAYKSKASLHL